MLRKRIQLGLIHVAVAMTLVPINSTLNRIMINELAISAALVAALASLPYLFSPIQVAIGAFLGPPPLVWVPPHALYCLRAGAVRGGAGILAPGRLSAFRKSAPWDPVSGCLPLAPGEWVSTFATVSYLSLASEVSGETRARAHDCHHVLHDDHQHHLHCRRPEPDGRSIHPSGDGDPPFGSSVLPPWSSA